MKYNYLEKERANKQLSLKIMFSNWHRHTGDYIRTGIFNPSTTCLDLEVAAEQNLIRKDSKLILFENFNKIPGGKTYINKFNFKKKIYSTLPMIPRENIYFHFDDLDKLQLGAALADVGASNVNFMFVDLCGLIDEKTARWILTNKPLVEPGSYQYYAVSLQGAVRTKKLDSLHTSNDLISWMRRDDDGLSQLMDTVGIVNDFTENEHNAIVKWMFFCSHLLNTNHQTGNINSIVYSSTEVQKMGIFNGRNGDVDILRWNYNYDVLFNSSKKHDDNIDQFGINWKNTGRKRTYTQGEISLFRNRELPDNAESKKPFHLYDYLRKHRGNKKTINNFNNITQIINVMYRDLYPQEYDRDRYKHSILTTNRTKQIIHKYLLNKPITVDEKQYVLVEKKPTYRYVPLDDLKRQNFLFKD